jgi:hypothetical protein
MRKQLRLRDFHGELVTTHKIGAESLFPVRVIYQGRLFIYHNKAVVRVSNRRDELTGDRQDVEQANYDEETVFSIVIY